MVGSMMALFWVIIALLGGLSAVVFIQAMGPRF